MKYQRHPRKPESVTRRDFLGATFVPAAAIALSGCNPGQKTEHLKSESTPAPTPAPPQPAPLAQGRSRDEVLELVDNKAEYYMRLCHNCAQTSFISLNEVFGLADPSFVKALTAMPGIAERGETCGAVTGCLLAMGLVFGRERLDDWAGWRACLVPCRKFCDQFVKEIGSTMCGDIVERLFGIRYNLADPADLGQFQAANPTEKCGGVVRKAVRIAAGIILDRG
ncbi:MAG: C-GCAxxG-C-C family protein [Verrucomicrobiota bacterium]|nr:C-GCAxxG-C-C family protein [Verrucomicrobiota bacterium]